MLSRISISTAVSIPIERRDDRARVDEAAEAVDRARQAHAGGEHARPRDAGLLEQLRPRGPAARSSASLPAVSTSISAWLSAMTVNDRSATATRT